MKLIYIVLFICFAFLSQGAPGTKPVPVMVDYTNGLLLSPTNFWRSNVVAGSNIQLIATSSNITINVTGTVASGSSGITNINGMTNSRQDLVTDITGTDFNITTNNGTNYFNLPLASSINTGKLSAIDWSTFNSKQPGNIDLTNIAMTLTNTFSTPLTAAQFAITNGLNGRIALFKTISTNSGITIVDEGTNLVLNVATNASDMVGLTNIAQIGSLAVNQFAITNSVNSTTAFFKSLSTNSGITIVDQGTNLVLNVASTADGVGLTNIAQKGTLAANQFSITNSVDATTGYFKSLSTNSGITITDEGTNLVFNVTASGSSSSLTNALLWQGPTNGSVDAKILTNGYGIILANDGTTNRSVSINTNIVAEITDLVWTNNGTFIYPKDGPSPVSNSAPSPIIYFRKDGSTVAGSNSTLYINPTNFNFVHAHSVVSFIDSNNASQIVRTLIAANGSGFQHYAYVQDNILADKDIPLGQYQVVAVGTNGNNNTIFFTADPSGAHGGTGFIIYSNFLEKININGVGGIKMSGGINSPEATVNSAKNQLIAGGQQHTITSTINEAVIVGGFQNRILAGNYSAIIGGSANTIDTNAVVAFIGGGQQNRVTYNSASIAGLQNAVDGDDSAIIAGNNSLITANAGWAAIIANDTSTITGPGGGDYYCILPGLNNNIPYALNSDDFIYILGGRGNRATKAESWVIGMFITNTAANQIELGYNDFDKFRFDTNRFHLIGNTQLRMTNGASDGYVLTSTNGGNARWMPPPSGNADLYINTNADYGWNTTLYSPTNSAISTDRVSLTIQGIVNQTGDLQQWLKSDGTTNVLMRTNGQLLLPIFGAGFTPTIGMVSSPANGINFAGAGTIDFYLSGANRTRFSAGHISDTDGYGIGATAVNPDVSFYRLGAASGAIGTGLNSGFGRLTVSNLQVVGSVSITNELNVIGNQTNTAELRIGTAGSIFLHNLAALSLIRVSTDKSIREVTIGNGISWDGATLAVSNNIIDGAITAITNLSHSPFASGQIAITNGNSGPDRKLKSLQGSSSVTLTDEGTNIVLTATLPPGSGDGAGIKVLTNATSVGVGTNLNIIAGTGISISATNLTGAGGTNTLAISATGLQLLTNANTLYVRKDGDNTTAIRGRFDKPWLTVSNALSFAQDGDTVLIYPGIYYEIGAIGPADKTFSNRCAMTLYGKRNISIKGINNPIIVVTNSASGLELYSCRDIIIDGITFEGLRLPGTELTNIVAMVDLREGCNNIRFRNLIFTNIFDHAVGVITSFLGSTNVFIESSCEFYNVGATSGVPSLTADGACIVPFGDNWNIGSVKMESFYRGIETYGNNCVNLTVATPRMTKCWREGFIVMDYDSTVYFKNSSISLDFADAEYIGFSTRAISIPFGDNILIHDCNLRLENSVYGITIGPPNVSGQGFFNSVIRNCTLYKGTNTSAVTFITGIAVQAYGLGAVSNLTIINNQFFDLYGTGIDISARDSLIAQNTFENVAVDGGRAIMLLNVVGDQENNRIIGNTFKPNSAAAFCIEFVDNASLPTNNIIIGNTFWQWATLPIKASTTNIINWNFITNQIFYGTNMASGSIRTIFEDNLLVSGNIYGGALVANTILKADSVSNITSIANGTGALTNNGSGGVGYFDYQVEINKRQIGSDMLTNIAATGAITNTSHSPLASGQIAITNGNTAFDRKFKSLQASTMISFSDEGTNIIITGTGQTGSSTLTNLSATKALTNYTVTYITNTGVSLYTVPSGVTKIFVQCLGGGGGGGAVDGAANQSAAAGGGGSGAYCETNFYSPAASYIVTIGTNGLGGATPSGSGTIGGSTLFTNILTATGGSGGIGKASAAAVSITLGGAGATETATGSLYTGGSPGANGICVSSTLAISGGGAGSIWGGGGAAQTAAVGSNATGKGAGGSGAAVITNTDRAGGNGSPGAIKVTEYYQ